MHSFFDYLSNYATSAFFIFILGGGDDFINWMDEPSTSTRGNPIQDLNYTPLEGVGEDPLYPWEIERANQLDQLRKEIIKTVRDLYRAHELPPVADEGEYSIMVDLYLSDIDHPTPEIYLSRKKELELSGINCERWKNFYNDWTSKEWKPKD